MTLDPEYTAEFKPSGDDDTNPKRKRGDTNPKREPGSEDSEPTDAPRADDRSPHAPREADHHAERDVYGGRSPDLADAKSKIKAPKSLGTTGRLTPPARQPLADGAWPSDAPSPAIAPFDERQARNHQAAWADYLKLPLEYTNSIGMKFILIPPGEFSMGSTPQEIEEALKSIDPNDTHWQECVKSEAPAHQGVITRPFYLSVHEVTQKEYETVMGQNPSHFARTSGDEKMRQAFAEIDTENFPVEQVSWNDAAEFCAKLSKQEVLKPFYFRVGEMVIAMATTYSNLWPRVVSWARSANRNANDPTNLGRGRPGR